MPRRRRTASAASPPWADLPPELLREIYGHLKFAADLVCFPAVCRPWHDAVAADRPLCFPPWADLPVEALRNISGRLHVASDFVRFRAVCWNWNVALDGDPPARLLPWLLAPSSAAVDEAEDQRCRCVFSKATYRAPGICFRDRRVACADGTAAWLLRDKEKTYLVNPLTAQRLALPAGNWWLNRRHRIIYGGSGRGLLYNFNPRYRFWAYFLHPSLGNRWVYVSSHLSTDRCCAAACHHGGYVVCVDLANCHVLRPIPEQYYKKCSYATSEVRAALPEEPAGKVRRCSYLLEYRGELLLASVLRDRQPAGRLSVSLHELRLGAGQNGDSWEPKVEWVRRDWSSYDMSLLDQDVLFLGFPNSFAVEAAEFGGEVSGGAAYFVIGGQGRSSGSPAAEATSCGVYRYSFHDGATALVERLPAGWHDARCMWFLPEPHVLAPYSVEDSEPTSSSGDYMQGYGNGGGARRQQLTIYAGDLPPRVDNSRLREMFSVYGKVAGARVAYDKRGRSRGFGFVTMATQEGFNKAMAPPNTVEEPPQHHTLITGFFALLVLILLIAALVYILQCGWRCMGFLF